MTSNIDYRRIPQNALCMWRSLWVGLVHKCACVSFQTHATPGINLANNPVLRVFSCFFFFFWSSSSPPKKQSGPLPARPSPPCGGPSLWMQSSRRTCRGNGPKNLQRARRGAVSAIRPRRWASLKWVLVLSPLKNLINSPKPVSLCSMKFVVCRESTHNSLRSTEEVIDILFWSNYFIVMMEVSMVQIPLRIKCKNDNFLFPEISPENS